MQIKYLFQTDFPFLKCEYIFESGLCIYTQL